MALFSRADERLTSSGLSIGQRRRAHVFNNLIFKCLGGVIFSVFLPALLYWPASEVFSPAPSLFNSMFSGVIITIIGTALLIKMVQYPHANGYSYVFPIFGFCIVAIFSVIFLGRMSFSIYLLLASSALSIIWGFIVVWIECRYQRPLYGIVPIGDAASVHQYGNVDWEFLHSPGDRWEDCDILVADLRTAMPSEWKHLLIEATLRRIPVFHSSVLEERITGRVTVDQLTENTFGWLLPSQAYEHIKLALDVIFALLAFILVFPILGLIAILIKVESPGPVLFVQERIGRGGKPFRIFKLRTMYHHFASGWRFTIEDDNRITPLGKFLRRYRIDEWPQMYNILLGQMSWIGPRPETRDLCEWHEDRIPYYGYRHTVRPGITGWAQVTQGAGTGISEVRVKLQHDFFYIKNYSPLLDLLIVFKTVRTVLTGFGAR
jgi:lipopolysaccharide/colanic/teichoic acid biosynthesis glycosyltransferase